MSDERYDLVILGGGNAISLAIRAGQAGWRVALIEKDLLGGTCPNRGCIPSKLLIAFADVVNGIREAGRFHVDATLNGIDRERLVRETIEATARATDPKLEAALPESVTLIRGHGRFVDRHTLEVEGRRVQGDRVVIAPGTRPREPRITGLEGTPYWVSDHVFELDSVPRSITIVGGGYIACELAHFFHGIDVETTLVHRGSELLKAEDREIREIFRRGFTSRVPTRLETRVTCVAYDGGAFRLELDSPAGSSRHESEALLFAIGRIPNTDNIDIERAGIQVDERGFVPVDGRLETGVEGIWALGDVKGRHLFTHAAAWEATYLAGRLLDGESGELEYGPMPHAVFSSPEIAGVGATEDELERDGTPFVMAALPYSTAAKGRAIKEEFGRCKLLLAPEGAILGCHIVGEHASILLHEVIPVMRWRNHVSSLTEIIHIHPALSEVVRNTARKGEAALTG